MSRVVRKELPNGVYETFKAEIELTGPLFTKNWLIIVISLVKITHRMTVVGL